MTKPIEQIVRLAEYNTSPTNVPHTMVGPDGYGYVEELPRLGSDVSAVANWLSEEVSGLVSVAVQGVRWAEQRVRVRATGNVNIASGLVNGALLNGVTLQTGDVVFLPFQSDGRQNGLYTVVAAGAGYRAAFADTAAELAQLGFVVGEGEVGYGEQWTLALAAEDIALGITILNFSLVGVSSSQRVFSSRTSLKAATASAGATAFLAEGARSGWFVFRSGDYSAKVAADTAEGIHVKANAIAASTGAWVRVFSGRIDIRWFGAVGDGVADDTQSLRTALSIIKLVGPSELFCPDRYRITSTVAESDVALAICGATAGKSAIISDGIASNQYVIAITNTTFTQSVTFQDISILASDDSVNCGIYVEWSLNDAVYGQAFPRFRMTNVILSGDDVSSIGWPTNGFIKGVTVKNASRPIFENVHQVGKRTSWSETGSSFLVVAFELLSDGLNAAPVDAIFSNCHVHAADTAVLASGHWEGIILDKLYAIQVKTALNATTGSVAAYPYVLVSNCHINAYRNAISITNFFDVKVIDNLIYKWDFPGSGGLVASTGVLLTGAPRSMVARNTFNNLTKDFGSNIRYDAVRIVDSNNVSVVDNDCAGVTYECTFIGTSAGGLFVAGQQSDIPGFSPTPERFRNSASGVNEQRGNEFFVSGASSGSGAIFGGSPVLLLNVGVPVNLYAGDIILVSAQAMVTKDSNAGLVSLIVDKNTGGATVEFEDSFTSLKDTRYMPAGSAMWFRVSGKMTVLTGGTFELGVRGECLSNGATTAIGDVQASVRRL